MSSIASFDTTSPKISVVIPTYNRGELLLRAVESVLSQTYTHLEVVVVDDGSSDDSIQMLKLAITDERLVVYELEENQGVHAVRNKGIDISQGEFIVFLDSDDWLYNFALDTFVSIWRKNNADWISAPYKVSTTGELSGLESDISEWIPTKDIFCGRRFRREKNCSVFIKKELIGDIRFVAPNLDYVFYRKLTRNADLYYCAQPLGIYYKEQNSNSMTVQRRKPNIALSIQRAEALDDFLREFKKDYLAYCPRGLVGNAYGAAVGLLLRWRQHRAILRSFQAMYYSNFNKKYVVFFCFTVLPGAPILLRFLFHIKRVLVEYSSKKLVQSGR